MISEAALAELKARHPCEHVASQWVTLRRKGSRWIGPCPLHSPNPAARDSTSFECASDWWVCATCHDGGDVVRLVMHREKLDFPAAVERLGGVRDLAPDRAREIEAELCAKREKALRDSEIFRERERGRAYDIWHRHRGPYVGTPVENYLRDIRRLPCLPDGLRLRYAPSVPFFHGEDKSAARPAARLIHEGPAMLAPIVDIEGVFRGVHITWLDLAQPNGKALILDPDSGEELPAEKVRGSPAGHAIRLVDVPAPSRLGAGEGIETVLSVWAALHSVGRDLRNTAFWSSVSLSNLAGRAAASVAHPTLRDAAHRTRRVPGSEPDPGGVAMRIPDTVKNMILLGDGDSDRFTTQCALARATKRHAQPGRSVLTAWAPDGMDFNDIVRAA